MIPALCFQDNIMEHPLHSGTPSNHLSPPVRMRGREPARNVLEYHQLTIISSWEVTASKSEHFQVSYGLWCEEPPSY